MKIVVVSGCFAEKMGYAPSLLPSALARLGAEVHVVTSDLQPPFPNYAEAYEPFLGPRQQPTGRVDIDGYTLHRLPHRWQRPGEYIRGLHEALQALRPEVVQCFTIHAWSTYQAVLSKFLLGYELFLEEHVHRSVFWNPGTFRNRIWRIARRSLGRIISLASRRCYPIAPDVAELSFTHFGLSRSKIHVCPLGVDTSRFTPIWETDGVRQEMRMRLGFQPDDIVCVYSGRFSPDKNPHCLAQAIDILRRRDTRFRGLFIGSGTADEVERLRNAPGCVQHPFVPWSQLPALYQSADVGVWPKQESTSQLDVLSCGLPLIVSDRVQARERHEAYGLQYRENDPADLAEKILSLADAKLRRRMGELARAAMVEHCSWDVIARKRLDDYRRAREGSAS